MRQIFSLVIAGVIGGAVALGSAKLLTKPDTAVVNAAPSYSKLANTTTYTAVGTPLDFTAPAERALPSVVSIKASESKAALTQRQNRSRQQNPMGDDDFFSQFFQQMPGQGQPQQGSGSGVIVSPDGYIVTNNHVVDFADEFEVTLYDDRKFSAKLVGKDASTDLAVIKIEAKGLPAIQRADSDLVKVGQWALAIGNPFGYLNSTVTAGIISAKGRSINEGNQDRSKMPIESFIQTDAAVNPGNSGGALVDTEGRLIGINAAIATRTGSFAGYSFAIPVNLMNKVIEDIISFGSYRRAMLGVSISNISDLSQAEKEQYKITVSQGVIIGGLTEGGAAQYAGILPNDIIVKINGRDIKNESELREIVGRTQVGDVINVTIIRDGTQKEIPVKLKKSTAQG
jgi:serine protease Do